MIFCTVRRPAAGGLTPMAMSAYYLKGIAPPQVQLTQIFAGSLPYVFMVFITMALVYTFPGVVYYLPTLFYGK